MTLYILYSMEDYVAELNENALRLLKQRYLQDGEDWAGLVERVVNHVCAGESDEYKNAVRGDLLDLVWLPNSPCLVGAGRGQGLFACFVVGPREDSLTAHLEALRDIAMVGKSGGGCGFTGSFIRAEGSPVAGSSHGYAYGPNNWALQVSNYLDMITQGGFRKMALMYTLDSNHPDLDKFIQLKQRNETDGNRFNQSVMARDEWMKKALQEGAKEAGQFDALARSAWNNGEPGLLFHDTINGNTPYSTCDCPQIFATNPCSEQGLPEFGSCNLGSINIAHERFFNGNRYNWSALSDTARTVTRFLDDVGMRNKFPNYKFAEWYEKHRPVGVGVMGVADALLKLDKRYGEQDAVSFLERVMETVYKAAEKESIRLGNDRGIPAHCQIVGRRNITLTTIAPTGSISFLAGCSSSIEPIFAPEYTRTDERGETYTVRHEMADEPHFVSAINDDPDKIPTWKQHVDMQLAAQKWVDSGVSKTCNFPNSTTVDDIKEAFIYAWKNGAKGITVYRDGSRQVQVLTTGETTISRQAPKRPEYLDAEIHRVVGNGHRWYILVGFYEEKPYEVFAIKTEEVLRHKYGQIRKLGGGKYDLLDRDGEMIMENITDTHATDEELAITRLVSLCLRHGIDIKFVVEQLSKTGGTVVAFTSAVKRIIGQYIPDGETIKCAQCKSPNVVFESGCATCKNCGYSACG
jgi:ribonucleoside-diphosphate reductase alpha chain